MVFNARRLDEITKHVCAIRDKAQELQSSEVRDMNRKGKSKETVTEVGGKTQRGLRSEAMKAAVQRKVAGTFWQTLVG